MIPPANRLGELPPYVFAELSRLKERVMADGKNVIDLGVGNPDGRPSAATVDALDHAIRDIDHNRHGYAGFAGHIELRQAVAQWYQRRFAVSVDADREVLPVLGSKEGLFHLMMAYLDPDDTILIPTPCYPAYLGAARLMQANVVELALREEAEFLIEFADIPSDVARSARMLLMNYPNNPTGAIAPRQHLRDAVQFCRDHDLMLVSDIAYCDLSLEDDHRPSSVLELPGAREQAVELSSLSKSHSMAGWRTGFCVGNADVIANLGKLKSNADFGIFLAIQHAAAHALTHDDTAVAKTRDEYRARRDRLCSGLNQLGWPVRIPPATMYVWTRVPTAWGDDDWKFTTDLLERTGVMITPGSAFGAAGRGYVRFSLVANAKGIDDVLQRLRVSKLFDGQTV